MLLNEIPFKIMFPFPLLDNTLLNAPDCGIYMLCTYAFQKKKKGTPRQSTIYGLLRNTDNFRSKHFVLNHIVNAELEKIFFQVFITIKLKDLIHSSYICTVCTIQK